MTDEQHDSVIGIHRHLERLDDHVADLRKQLTESRLESARQIGALEVAIANRGREPLPKGLWLTAGMLVLALVVQGAAVFRWTGQIETRMASVEDSQSSIVNVLEKTAGLIDEHLRSAGPFREGVARWQKQQEECEKRISTLELQAQKNALRIDDIEKHNAVADRNWEKLIARGLLVEKP